MKTLCLALLLTLSVAAMPVAAPALTLAPTPAPTASPVPEAKPAPDGTCPECGMEKDGNGVAQQAPSEAEKAVIALEIKWCEAEARHDVPFLEKVEADGFTFTDFTGALTTKQDEIAEAKKGGDKIDYKLSDMKAHVYGGTVVLTGQTTFLVADSGSAPLAYRWTDVFVRQGNGEWQVVASQTTAIAQAKAEGEGQSE